MKHTLIAIKAAIEAGKEILKVYSSADFEVEIKGDKSPLTLADRQSHLKIITHLSETEFPILSEESDNISYEERKQWKTFWLVDPLDGTKEFIKKNGEFTVNIALIKNDTPIFGVIYIPVQKKLFFTTEDTSYKMENIADFQDFSMDKAIPLSPRTGDEKDFVIVASKSHLTSETEAIIEKITAEKPHQNIAIKSVGSSLKLCLVAEGEANFYPRYAPTMEWDIAAGDAICRKAGIAVVQAASKSTVVYNKENLLNPWFEVGSY